MELPKFVELHSYNSPASIDVNSIAFFKDNEFRDSLGNKYYVDETYDEIKKLMENAGCKITKKEKE